MNKLPHKVLLGKSSVGMFHALRQPDRCYCGRSHRLIDIHYGGVGDIDCRQCRGAYERLVVRLCGDCGQKMKEGDYGKYCVACKMYHTRYSRRRGRQRKPAYVVIRPERLRELHREYHQESKSLNELANREGVSLPTLRTKFREAGLSLRKRGIETAQARRLRDLVDYPRHPYADALGCDVSDMEDSVLRVIELALMDGKQISARLLEEQSAYSGKGSIDAFYRLQRRGFVLGGMRNAKLTPMALERRVRPGPGQRMAESYVPGMTSGDLARAAGVEATSAVNYIKRLQHT